MPSLILGIALFAALAVAALRFLSPGNPVARYLIPRFLPSGNQPKAVVRQAGISWILFSAWLITVAFSMLYLFPKDTISRYPLLMGLLFFVVPVTVVVLQIAGWYYLFIGTFSRKQQIKPGLRSYYEIEPDLLDRDIHRLGRCTTINLVSLFLVIALPVTEALLRVEPEPPVVLVNVALLITWIFSMRRMQYYLIRTVRAMASVGDDPSTLPKLRSHWLMIWRDSYRVRTYYESYWRPRHASATPQGLPEYRN